MNRSYPKNILLVDDNRLVLEAVTEALMDSGYTVETLIPDGVTSLGKVRMRPDIVLTDLQMPAVSGLYVAKQARWNWPDAKVLLWSEALQLLKNDDISHLDNVISKNKWLTKIGQYLAYLYGNPINGERPVRLCVSLPVMAVTNDMALPITMTNLSTCGAHIEVPAQNGLGTAFELWIPVQEEFDVARSLRVGASVQWTSRSNLLKGIGLRFRRTSDPFPLFAVSQLEPLIESMV